MLRGIDILTIFLGSTLTFPVLAADRTEQVAGWTLSDTGGTPGNDLDREVVMVRTTPGVELVYKPGPGRSGSVSGKFAGCNKSSTFNAHLEFKSSADAIQSVRDEIAYDFAEFRKECAVTADAEKAVMEGFDAAFKAVSQWVQDKPFVYPPNEAVPGPLTMVFPSPSSGGEGRAALAAKGEGALLLTSPAPWLRFASPVPLPLKGVREGWVAAERRQNRPGDAFGVGQDFAVGEAEDAIALGFQKFRAGSIVGLAARVAVAIEYDDQAFGAGREIGDVGRDDDLPREFDAQPVASDDVPQRLFGRGLVGAEGFGAASGFAVSLQFNFPLSPTPLRLKGVRGFVVEHHA